MDVPKNATKLRQSDAECFSPISDLHMPKEHIPPCAKCGKPSLGGVCLAVDPVAPVSCPIYLVEFYCADDAPASFITMSWRLYPAWRIVEFQTPSKMRIQRLPREAQIERVKG